MTRARPDTATIAAYAAMIVIAGSNFVAVRFSNEELPPFWGATLRFAIACALFFGVMRWRGAGLPRGSSSSHRSSLWRSRHCSRTSG